MHRQQQRTMTMNKENTKAQKQLTNKNAYELNKKLAHQLEQYEKELLSMIQDRTCKPIIEKCLKELSTAYGNLVGQIYKNVQ